MINQQPQRQQHLLRYQLVKLQLVDSVLHLQHHQREGSEVPHQQQQRASAQAAQRAAALVQVQQLERERLGLAQVASVRVAEAALEAHLAALAAEVALPPALPI